MIELRDWDELAVAMRLCRRKGELGAIYLAEKMIRKWAESDAPRAGDAAIRWVRIKAILHSLSIPADGVH
jgi:hypothetical protein